jgi:phosphoglycolate phosphatase-like HAD superfamily hydrolase
MLMVGDFRFDVESGRAAGCRTVFVRTSYDEDTGFGADYVIREMREVVAIVRGPLGG